MPYPTDLKYTKEHEWIRVSGDTADVGITDYAQRQLGDVVYVDLPDVGKTIKAGESFGSIESVKAVSELFAPMSGEVVGVNPHLKDHPEVINSDPYGQGWMVVIDLSNAGEVDKLMNAAQYEAFLSSQKKG